jgi:glycosyltransferase involved in cell wall biosynthesis
MKILITADPFIPVPPTLYGGIERILDMLINVYIELGHEVTLIAHPDSKPNKNCRFIPYASDKDSILRNSWLITQTHLKYKFDVIHSFSRLLYLLPLLPFSVAKVMSYQREPSIAQISKAYKLSKKGSILFTGCSDYISNQIKTVAEAYTVYNGVPIGQFHFNNELTQDAPLVFLGRIEEIKGTHIAIELAIKTNNRLIIAGNIPKEYQNYFDEKVKPYLNNQIQYLGPVNDIQKNELLRNAKAFLMPILWNEPFGIVMAEAMACGTPVIGFNRGSVPEVVEHNVSGFVCNTMEEMIEGINKLSLISRINVRNRAEQYFSSEVIAHNYLELYKKIQ